MFIVYKTVLFKNKTAVFPVGEYLQSSSESLLLSCWHEESTPSEKNEQCYVMYSWLFMWGAIFPDVFNLTRAGYFH